MIVLIVTDQHFGANSNNPFDYLYMTKYYHEVIFPLIKKHNIKHVIDIGDTFDETAQLEHRFKKKFESDYLNFFEVNKIKLHAITGNHNKNGTTEIFSKLENIVLYDHPRPIEIGNGCLFALPWGHAPEYNCEKFTDKIVFAHCSIKSMKSNPESLIRNGIQPEYFSNARKVYCGHTHTFSRYKNIVNLGSTHFTHWQNAIHQEPMGAYILDISSNTIQKIPNNFCRYRVISASKRNNIRLLPHSSIRAYIPLNSDSDYIKRLKQKISSHRPEKLIIISSPLDYLKEAGILNNTGYYKSATALCNYALSKLCRKNTSDIHYKLSLTMATSYANLFEFETALRTISPFACRYKRAMDLANILSRHANIS